VGRRAPLRNKSSCRIRITTAIAGKIPPVTSDWSVKNLYWLVPSLLVAIGGIATFIRWIIKKPKPSVESIQQTASPSLTQTANPNITQHVIVHPARNTKNLSHNKPRRRFRRGQSRCPILFSLEPEPLSLQAHHWKMFCRKREIVKGGSSDVTALVACFRKRSFR